VEIIVIRGSVAVRLVLAALLAAAIAPGGGPRAVQKSEAEVQLEFGVKMARNGSWREAAYRFERAVRADGANARAYNNLAVALESLGRQDEARAAYEKALALAPDDERIRMNYERFKNAHGIDRGRADAS
jgi:Tfp pilus assembly protein PilF